MCLEEDIHADASREFGEGLPGQPGAAVPYQQPAPARSRYPKLILALAAIISIFLARVTGIDQGLVDDVMGAAVAFAVPAQPARQSVPADIAPDAAAQAVTCPDGEIGYINAEGNIYHMRNDGAGHWLEECAHGEGQE